MEKKYNENEYTLEDLLPIVAELAKRYTSYESTSVTYEAAQKLMEAVQFCIRISRETVENQIVLKSGKQISAREAYEDGYQKVIEKVKAAKEKYNQMILHFQDYGNENYRDTVKKAIPGFFRYYDVRFAPQDAIIAFDYPTLWAPDACPDFARPAHTWQGIEAIEHYIECIRLEQKFLGKLPQGRVIQILDDYDGNYREQFYNICENVVCHILTRMSQNMYEDCRKEQLLWHLIQQQYDADERLYSYLKII